jgi:hypothetical protein
MFGETGLVNLAQKAGAVGGKPVIIRRMKIFGKKGGLLDWLLRQNPLAIALFFTILMVLISLYAGNQYENTVRAYKEANPVIQKTPSGYVPEEKVVVDNTERGMGFLDEILMEHSVASVLIVATLLIGTLILIPLLTFLYYYQKRRDEGRRVSATKQ